MECFHSLGVRGGEGGISDYMRDVLANKDMSTFEDDRLAIAATPDGFTPLHAAAASRYGKEFGPWPNMVASPYNGHRKPLDDVLAKLRRLNVSQRGMLSRELNRKAGADKVTPASLAVMAGHFPLAYKLADAGANASQLEMTVSFTGSIDGMVLKVESALTSGRIVPGMKVDCVTVLKQLGEDTFAVHWGRKEPIKLDAKEMTGTVSPADRLELVLLAYKRAEKNVVSAGESEPCDLLSFGAPNPVTVFTAMRTFPGALGVQRTGAWVVEGLVERALARGETKAHKAGTMLANGMRAVGAFQDKNIEQFVRTLANSIHYHSRDEEVSRYGLSAMVKLFTAADSAVRDEAMQAAREKGIINVALDSLRLLNNNDVEISRSAVTIVMLLLDTCPACPTGNPVAPMEITSLMSGSINHLSFTLRWNWKNVEVMEPTLNVLALLTNPVVLNTVKGHRVWLNPAEFINDMCSMLYYHLENGSLMNLVLMVMHNVLKEFSDVVDSELLTRLMEVLAYYCKMAEKSACSEEVVTNAVRVLSLATRNTSLVPMSIIEGLIPAMMDSLVQFGKGSMPLRTASASTVKHLADSGYGKECIESGVIPVLLEAQSPWGEYEPRPLRPEELVQIQVGRVSCLSRAKMFDRVVVSSIGLVTPMGATQATMYALTAVARDLRIKNIIMEQSELGGASAFMQIIRAESFVRGNVSLTTAASTCFMEFASLPNLVIPSFPSDVKKYLDWFVDDFTTFAESTENIPLFISTLRALGVLYLRYKVPHSDMKLSVLEMALSKLPGETMKGLVPEWEKFSAVVRCVPLEESTVYVVASEELPPHWLQAIHEGFSARGERVVTNIAASSRVLVVPRRGEPSQSTLDAISFALACGKEMVKAGLPKWCVEQRAADPPVPSLLSLTPLRLAPMLSEKPVRSVPTRAQSELAALLKCLPEIDLRGGSPARVIQSVEKVAGGVDRSWGLHTSSDLRVQHEKAIRFEREIQEEEEREKIFEMGLTPADSKVPMGITLHGLRSLAKTCGPDWTTGRVKEAPELTTLLETVKAQHAGGSFVDYLVWIGDSKGVAPVTRIVSHSYDAPFNDLLVKLTEWEQWEENAGASHGYYIDFLVVNPFETRVRHLMDRPEAYLKLVENVEGVLFVSNPGVWGVAELALAKLMNKEVTMLGDPSNIVDDLHTADLVQLQTVRDITNLAFSTSGEEGLKRACEFAKEVIEVSPKTLTEEERLRWALATFTGHWADKVPSGRASIPTYAEVEKCLKVRLSRTAVPSRSINIGVSPSFVPATVKQPKSKGAYGGDTPGAYGGDTPGVYGGDTPGVYAGGCEVAAAVGGEVAAAVGGEVAAAVGCGEVIKVPAVAAVDAVMRGFREDYDGSPVEVSPAAPAEAVHLQRFANAVALVLSPFGEHMEGTFGSCVRTSYRGLEDVPVRGGMSFHALQQKLSSLDRFVSERGETTILPPGAPTSYFRSELLKLQEAGRLGCVINCSRIHVEGGFLCGHSRPCASFCSGIGCLASCRECLQPDESYFSTTCLKDGLLFGGGPLPVVPIPEKGVGVFRLCKPVVPEERPPPFFMATPYATEEIHEAVKAGAVGGPRAPAEVEHRTHEEEAKRVADNMEAIGKLREFLRAAILRDDAGAWDHCERLLLGASQKGCGVRYEFPSAP